MFDQFEAHLDYYFPRDSPDMTNTLHPTTGRAYVPLPSLDIPVAVTVLLASTTQPPLFKRGFGPRGVGKFYPSPLVSNMGWLKSRPEVASRAELWMMHN